MNGEESALPDSENLINDGDEVYIVYWENEQLGLNQETILLYNQKYYYSDFQDEVSEPYSSLLEAVHSNELNKLKGAE